MALLGLRELFLFSSIWCFYSRKSASRCFNYLIPLHWPPFFWIVLFSFMYRLVLEELYDLNCRLNISWVSFSFRFTQWDRVAVSLPISSFKGMFYISIQSQLGRFPWRVDKTSDTRELDYLGLSGPFWSLVLSALGLPLALTCQRSRKQNSQPKHFTPVRIASLAYHLISPKR